MPITCTRQRYSQFVHNPHCLHFTDQLPARRMKDQTGCYNDRHHREWFGSFSLLSSVFLSLPSHFYLFGLHPAPPLNTDDISPFRPSLLDFHITGALISSEPDQEGNKLQRQKILMFIDPIYNRNWRNISTIYIYNKTSIKRNILTSKQNTSGSRSG